MSGSLRYNDRELCDQLAAQYVAGDMTPRVRRRTEQLMRHYPQLQTAVDFWCANLEPLQRQYPSQPVPDELWQRIERRVKADAKQRQADQAPSFWSRLVERWDLWRTSAVGGMATALALVVTLTLVLAQPTELRAADYMAPLTWNSEVALVVSGYKGQDGDASWLSVQWSERLSERPQGDLYLWADGGDGNAWVYLGKVTPDNRRWQVESSAWQAVANSRHLAVSDSADGVSLQQAAMQGPCIQLKNW
ncbi:hypothetical protein [Saccharospirillum mangrovi]|uniref:hypothetical protein n=1 Tax=Saccharospirillum mangrovi TaxID=2161747 RepID=UPI000D3515EB|nr:hypothetical protein [Saccharospirillum mangrovi]